MTIPEPEEHYIHAEDVGPFADRHFFFDEENSSDEEKEDEPE